MSLQPAHPKVGHSLPAQIGAGEWYGSWEQQAWA